jgi:hypothetical protein
MNENKIISTSKDSIIKVEMHATERKNVHNASI